MVFYKMNRQQGFTLLELVITVAIIGILTAIAYPSYVKSVQKGKRTDAKVELLRIAQMQEGYFAQNMSYAKNLTQLGLASDTISSEQDEYDLTVGTVTPGNCTGTSAIPSCLSYRLDATPASTSAQVHDTHCPKFTLSSTGQKGTSASATAAEIKKCWR